MGFNIFECAHSRFVIHNMGHYLYFDICGWPHNNRQWWNSPSHCCYLSFKNIFSQVPWFIALFLGHWSTQRCWWDELFLSQSKHIQEILYDTQVQYCKGIQSPMSMSETLLVNDGAPKTDGCLVSFSTFLLPNLTSHTHSTSLLSIILLHMCFTKAVKRILR